MPDISTDHDLNTRIEVMENHIAHLEYAQQELSDVLAQQWNTIDRLLRTVEHLHQTIQTMGPEYESRKPPHY